MPEKFKNKYRIPSARLQSWNYANAGAYFITICTKDRQHYLGQIENHKIRLSNIGIIAHIMWFEIKKHVKNVELGEFVVMPNHIHGILILNENVCPNVETLHATSLPQKIDLATNKTELMSAISPKSNSISTIIRSYKSAVTKYCNQLGFDFFWQTRFYDHIILNEKSFSNIENYIINNPLNWAKDKFYGDR